MRIALFPPVLALLLAATMVTAPPAHAQSQDQDQDHEITWAAQGDALTYDPHGQNEGRTLTLLKLAYEPLIQRAPDMSLIPALATAWELVAPDLWAFTLREGVRFHDGTPLTAADVVFSLNRALAPTSDMKGNIDSIVDISVAEDGRVRVRTAGPNPILPDQLTNIFVMSRDWAETHGVEQPQNRAAGEETYAVRHANGTGPYRLILREPDIRTVHERNPDWWGWDAFPGNIDRVTFRPLPNDATRMAGLLSGSLDMVLDVPVQDVRRVQATPGLKVQEIAELRTIFFGMDVTAPPFDDIRVRRALDLAIDRNAIVRAVMRGHAVPAGMLTEPGVRGHDPALDQPTQPDPAAARALLAEAGFPEGFETVLDCPNDRYVNDEAICQAVVGMLARIGVRAELSSRPRTLHFALIQNRETDFYLLGWGNPVLDSHYVFNHLMLTGAGWNATGWSDPAFDALVGRIATETDAEARLELIGQAWAMQDRAKIYLPVHHQGLIWAMRRDFTVPIQPDNQPQFRYAVLGDGG